MHSLMSYTNKAFFVLFYRQWRASWRNWVANTPSGFPRGIVKVLEGLKKQASRNDSKNKTIHLVLRGWWGIGRMPLKLCSSTMRGVTVILGTRGCHNHCCYNSPGMLSDSTQGYCCGKTPCSHTSLQIANNQTDRKLAPASRLSSKYLTGVHQMGGT